MSKTNDNLQEIRNTLEEIRASHYSDIPESLIKEIIDIQFANQEQDSRIHGRSATQQTIKAYIEQKG